MINGMIMKSPMDHNKIISKAEHEIQKKCKNEHKLQEVLTIVVCMKNENQASDGILLFPPEIAHPVPQTGAVVLQAHTAGSRATKYLTSCCRGGCARFLETCSTAY